jgi:hypothetical protein
MSSLVVDLIMCGLAYVVLIFIVATLTKARINRDKDNNDDGDGGVEDFTPPKIDLPPGVIWPSDGSKKKKTKPYNV